MNVIMTDIHTNKALVLLSLEELQAIYDIYRGYEGVSHDHENSVAESVRVGFSAICTIKKVNKAIRSEKG